MTPVRLTLDTDIGTDVDDVLALATILGSPELSLAAVTTVYGDVLLRARLAARVIRLAGDPAVPVVPGRAETRSGRPVWWPGHEGTLYDDLGAELVATEPDAIELLASSPVVVAIGPLTNVAGALEESSAATAELYVMGGDFPAGVEHNVRCDVTAADAVFGAGVRATVIGLDQTQRLRIGAADVARFEAAGPLGGMLGAEIRHYWQVTGRSFNVPHDPAAVLMLTDPGLFTFSAGRIDVDAADGVTTFTPDPDGPHRIVTDLDVPAVSGRIVDRILAACDATTRAPLEGESA
jgi:purine nucleosidase